MTDVCEICGLQVSRGDLLDHVQAVTGRARQGQGGWLLTLNTEMLARGSRDPGYLGLIRQADIITADGMPLVWASKFKYPATAIISTAFVVLFKYPALATFNGLIISCYCCTCFSIACYIQINSSYCPI